MALWHRAGGGNLPARGIALAVLPGDDQPDPELARFSTLAGDAAHRLWQYAVHGGVENAAGLLRYAAHLIGYQGAEWREPVPLMRAGIYWPGRDRPALEDLRRDWVEERLSRRSCSTGRWSRRPIPPSSML